MIKHNARAGFTECTDILEPAGELSTASSMSYLVLLENQYLLMNAELGKRNLKPAVIKDGLKSLHKTSSVALPWLNVNAVPEITRYITENSVSPVELFKMIFDIDILTHICKETVKYAVTKGYTNFEISVDEMYVYFAILLFSGYVKLLDCQMHWQIKQDTYNFPISNSMSSNRFEQIHDTSI